MNIQFQLVFATEDTNNLQPNKGESLYPAMNNLTVSEKGVRKHLQNLQSDKLQDDTLSQHLS